MIFSARREKILQWAGERGVIRPHELRALGISPSNLYPLVECGLLRRIGRGLYSPANTIFTASHSLVEAVKVQSKGVVCLLSALSFHGIGTQLPHEVWLAIPYGTRVSKATYPPRQVTVLRPHVYEAGIEVHAIEGVEVPVYSIAKTVADCFKFRSKVGLDVAVEALREAIYDRRCSRSEIHRYAVINRVDNVIRPYMEAFTSITHRL